MKILIMGGSYFIGWHLVNKLAKDGHIIWVFNRGTKQRKYPSNVKHLKGDRNDVPKMLELINQFTYDVIFDFSAFKSEQIEVMIKNFLGKIKRFFFISTAAVYVQSEIFPIKEEFPVGKHHIWGSYGSNKLDCEKILLDAFYQNGFPVTIFRPSYVYGPENYILREKFLYDRISQSRKILVPGDGNAIIQLGHVFDLTEAWIATLLDAKSIGKIYNISGEEYITLNGLVHFVGELMHKSFDILHINPEEFNLTARDIFPFDNCTYLTDITKIKNDLKFIPKYNLKTGLEEGLKLWLKSSQKNNLSDYSKEDFVLKNIKFHG